MSLKHRISCFCLLALLFSVMGSPVKAQERPPGTAQNMPRGYSMPSLFPLYFAPPIHFRDNRFINIVFTTTPEVLRDLVPEPLVPNPANRMFIYMGSLNVESPPAGSIHFLEAAICVPVVFPETKAQGNYAVCLYLNKALPIVLGREIWGWPKKDAEIAFTEEDGEISGRVERLGTVLLSVSGKRGSKVDPVTKQPQLPWFVQKIIPSAQKNAPPDVWQLVSSVNIDTVITELWNCTAKLEFGSGPQDPLGNIKVLEIVSAQFSHRDFAMDYGEVLHNYLPKK
jgi:acetoacetate decarboxylase